MDHFIVPDGPFIVSAKKLLASGFELSWLDRYPTAARSAGGGGGGSSVAEGVPMLPVATSPSPLQAADDELVLGHEGGEAPDRSNRRKYRCAGCGVNAWAKPGVRLVCGECNQAMPDTAAP